jgi:hypothetical protein
VKHYQLLNTNQPCSSQDLSVEEYTAELIKKKGAPLKSSKKKEKSVDRANQEARKETKEV